MRFKGKMEWFYLIGGLIMLVLLVNNVHKLVTDAEYRQSVWGIVAIIGCVCMGAGFIISLPLVMRNHCELGATAILYRFGWVKRHIDYDTITEIKKVTNRFARMAYDVEIHYETHGFPHTFVFNARDADGFVAELHKRIGR